jgi:hypothetical protein
MQRLVLALAAASAIGFAPVPASAVEQPLVVAGHVVVEGGNHVWDQPVVVGPGSTLTIKDATVWLDWVPPICTKGTAGYCQPNIMILAGGALEVIDSMLDNHGWLIDDADTGYAIHALGGTLRLEDSVFQHYKAIGGQGALARSTVTGSTFRWAISGVSFIRGSDADILGNSFEDVMFGVSIRDASGVVRGNRFNRSQRLFATEPFGRAIDVEDTIVGEKQFATMPIVEGNLIENGSQGMLNLNGFPNIVRNNTFRNNRIGASIGLSAGETTFNQAASSWTGNRFEGNLEALQVYVSGAPQNGTQAQAITLRGNSFLDTICTSVTAMPTAPSVALSVDANDNWWGSAAGPQDSSDGCPPVSGDVTADTWLTEAP